MSKITIQQGNVKAIVSDICYSPASSGIEDATPYVIEELLSATVEEELRDGDAVLIVDGNAYPVVLEAADFIEEDEDSVYEVEITPVEGSLPKLADALGLLDTYSKTLQKALLGEG